MIKTDLKRLEMRSKMQALNMDDLETKFLDARMELEEAQRELNERWFKRTKHASGIISVKNARLFENDYY